MTSSRPRWAGPTRTCTHSRSVKVGSECASTTILKTRSTRSSVAVEAALRGHKHFVYDYDFGDRWSHTITIERELRTPHALKYAICLDGAGACPPEDSGGPGGFEYALEALADPSHEEHDDYLRWFGSPTFDRSAFDLVEINAMLQRVPQRTRHLSDSW